MGLGGSFVVRFFRFWRMMRLCYLCGDRTWNMKQVFAIFFACYFLFGGLSPKKNLSQLQYLLETVEHFNCHQSEAASIGNRFTLLDFISLHLFSTEKHEHPEDHNHDQAPMQQSSLNNLQVVINQVQGLHHCREFTSTYHTIGHLVCYKGNDFSKGIDHPPSIA